MQTAERETTSFLVDVESHVVLIDAGPGVVRQLLRAGRSPIEIDTIVITHGHGDHVAGYAYLMFAVYAALLQAPAQAEHRVRVVAAAETTEGLQAMLSFMYPPGTFSNFTIDHRIVADREGSVVELGGSLVLRTCPVTHAVPTIAVRIEGQGRSLTYSSDTVYDPRVVALAKDTDLLIHEAFATGNLAQMAAGGGHAVAAEAGRVGAEAGARRLALSHAIPPMWSDIAPLLAEAGQAYGGEVELPSDLSVLSV